MQDRNIERVLTQRTPPPGSSAAGLVQVLIGSSNAVVDSNQQCQLLTDANLRANEGRRSTAQIP